MPYLPQPDVGIIESIDYSPLERSTVRNSPANLLKDQLALKGAQREEQHAEQGQQNQLKLRDALKDLDPDDPDALRKAGVAALKIDPTSKVGPTLFEHAEDAATKRAQAAKFTADAAENTERTNQMRIADHINFLGDLNKRVTGIGSTLEAETKNLPANGPSYRDKVEAARTKMMFELNDLRRTYAKDPNAMSILDTMKADFTSLDDFKDRQGRLVAHHEAVTKAATKIGEFEPDPEKPGAVRPVAGGARDPKTIEADAAAKARGTAEGGAAGVPPGVDNASMDVLADMWAKGAPAAQLVRGQGKAAERKLDLIQTTGIKNLMDRVPGITHERAAQVLNDARAEYGGEMASERTLGVRGANLSAAGAELKSFVPIALDAESKVARTAWRPLNSLIQAGANTWDPDQRALVAANQSVINAFAQVATRGVPTVHSTEEAEKMLNTADSHEAYQRVLKQLTLEADAALQAVPEARAAMRAARDKQISGAIGGGRIVAASKEDLQKLIADKKLKKGDTFYDPDNNPHVVK